MGVFDLGGGKTLVTDLRALDQHGDHAVVLQTPDPEKVAAVRARNGRWRVLVGAFQLGIPVSTKADMLSYHLRLYSVLLWRLEKLPQRSRWLATMRRYLALWAEKVRALGGRPELVPATPDGIFELEPAGGKPPVEDPKSGDGDGGPIVDGGADPTVFEPDEDWLGEPGPATSHLWSGKVSSLLYDHFGDFEGLTLEDHQGRHVRFFSRERAILELAKEAWQQRYVVSVVSVSKTNRTVVRLLIRGYR